MVGSRALISATPGMMRLRARSLEVPKTFAITVLSTDGCVLLGRAVEPSPSVNGGVDSGASARSLGVAGATGRRCDRNMQNMQRPPPSLTRRVRSRRGGGTGQT